MKIEEKRKFFLEVLDKKYNEFLKTNSKVERYAGPGIKRKLLRFIFAPKSLKINLLRRKIGFFHKKLLRKSKLFWGKEIILDIKDWEGFQLNQLGFLSNYEVKLTKFLIKYLKETDVFYDIGANYGFYTYLALEFVKEVHLFEPIPEVFEILELNLKGKKNVHLNKVALGDREKEEDFYFVEQGSGKSTLIESALKYIYFPYRKIKVKIITLDEYVKNHTPPTFLKLDVEGAESLVIEGGSNFLKNFSPAISMEVWSKERGGKISQKAIEKLRSLGYNSYFIKEDGEIEISFGDLTSKILPPQEIDNFIFLKNAQ